MSYFQDRSASLADMCGVCTLVLRFWDLQRLQSHNAGAILDDLGPLEIVAANPVSQQAGFVLNQLGASSPTQLSVGNGITLMALSAPTGPVPLQQGGSPEVMARLNVSVEAPTMNQAEALWRANGPGRVQIVVTPGENGVTVTALEAGPVTITFSYRGMQARVSLEVVE